MIVKLKGVIKSFCATTLSRLITIGQRVHKHRVEITWIEDQPSYFDLSIPDLNAERNPLSLMENYITILYNIIIKQRIKIEWTTLWMKNKVLTLSFDHVTWKPTDGLSVRVTDSCRITCLLLYIVYGLFYYKHAIYHLILLSDPER